ncbi:MAG: 23S rRNA (guanosine(2251)-2'-O)-methyltransferase RlmB [Eubacteriales bacterium]|jgi:23S rRNA (guanosine2251-2'-O)-methyltransferase
MDKEKRNHRGNKNTDPEVAADGVVEGRNPVMEALKAGRKVDKLFVIEGSRSALIQEIISRARDTGAVIVETDRRRLDAMSVTRSHQGVIAFIPVREYSSIEEVLETVRNTGKTPLLVVCDHIEDPNNLGAIIRTAEASGADAVVIPKRRSAGLTATVSKASAGALEHMKVIKVSNIANFLRKIKQYGIWVFGMSMDGDKTIYEADFTLPAAIVVGSEGEGISNTALKECDFLTSIPMVGAVSSLNASAAAAVVLYEAVRQRMDIG